MSISASSIQHESLEDVLHYETGIIIERGLTMTKPGSVKYLLYGKQPSTQSLNIRMGKVGEKIMIWLINNYSNAELLAHGIVTLNNGERKDVDLLWRNIETNTVYYREFKSNANLDTEKVPATLKKIEQIKEGFLYPTYGKDVTFDVAILNWGVYERSDYHRVPSQINVFEEAGIRITHLKDDLEVVGYEWSKEEFHACFRDIGRRFQKMLNDV